MTTLLYHYTTPEGAQGILDSGVVMRSMDQRFAHYGHGVYLTSKSPLHNTMEDIAINNFDGQVVVYRSMKNLGKVGNCRTLETLPTCYSLAPRHENLKITGKKHG